jgi:hypothetical protein
MKRDTMKLSFIVFLVLIASVCSLKKSLGSKAKGMTTEDEPNQHRQVSSSEPSEGSSTYAPTFPCNDTSVYLEISYNGGSPSGTSWELQDSNGNIQASGGEYNYDDFEDSTPPSSLVETICVSSDTCTFIITDTTDSVFSYDVVTSRNDVRYHHSWDDMDSSTETLEICPPDLTFPAPTAPTPAPVVSGTSCSFFLRC